MRITTIRKSVKNVLFFLLLGLMAFRCGSSPEPEPKTSLFMNAWVEYTASPITLELRGMAFRSMAGPEVWNFDKAEVYISEGQPTNLQLLTTTTQTRLSLVNLKPGTVYYIAVKGTFGDYVSEMSKPILVVPEVVKPVQKLMPYDRMSNYQVSPSGQRAIRQYRDATGAYITQLIDATGSNRVLTYTNTEGAFFCRTWTADSQQALFEITRAKKRAFVRYDVKANTFTDVPLPTEADLWNYSFAPDGQQLVFSDYKRPGLWYFDGRNNTQKQLDSQQTIYDLSWTADSRFALLTKPTLGDKQLVVQYDPQTGSQTEILSVVAPVSGAKPSPDGRYFLFNSTLSGQPTIWLQDRQTRALRPVSNGSQFGWLTDGTLWTDYRLLDNTIPGERESFLWVVKP
jgi:hypothetical protein